MIYDSSNRRNREQATVYRRTSGKTWFAPVFTLNEVPALVHNCSSCSLAEIWFEENGSDVYLNLNRVATEEDLETHHYLEHEGQTIETVHIQVAFCPYCGHKLASGKEVVVPQFQHYNFGGSK